MVAVEDQAQDLLQLVPDGQEVLEAAPALVGVEPSQVLLENRLQPLYRRSGCSTHAPLVVEEVENGQVLPCGEIRLLHQVHVEAMPVLVHI